MKILNPLEIKEKDLPLIVLVDDRRSFFSWLTKAHTSGNYGHIMELYKPEILASQDFRGFREVNISKYMKPSLFLKFWRVKDLTGAQRNKWLSKIDSDLNASWFKHRYDFIGLIGQLLNVRWINNPRTRYCSERVATRLRTLFERYIPLHPNPSELDTMLKSWSNMEVIGYWFQD